MVDVLVSRGGSINGNVHVKPPYKHIRIASDPALAKNVQEEVEAALLKWNYPEKEVFSIKLALEEALVNAIKHGNQLNPAKSVDIIYYVSRNRFEVHIKDEGQGFDPEDLPDPLAPENLERDCGRGLMLMRHYMTYVNVQAPGNWVAMAKVLNQAEEETVT